MSASRPSTRWCKFSICASTMPMPSSTPVMCDSKLTVRSLDFPSALRRFHIRFMQSLHLRLIHSQKPHLSNLHLLPPHGYVVVIKQSIGVASRSGQNVSSTAPIDARGSSVDSSLNCDGNA
ncbi:hypothetical protein M9H77_22927 [Catharanthus roseus]|uniref:Uncharacterized protein n=1 Tax=Catharanthus roseus TaxID=4058 RepID=A0ACC0AST5_CATRO|nr:hypothetical protein M9H77_22927 [Catharanthus roseus]